MKDQLCCISIITIIISYCTTTGMFLSKHKQTFCLLLLSFFCVYLEYRQKALTKSIKIASGLWSQWIIVKSGAKNLHSQKGKDAHEQKEQDQKWGNRFDRVDQGGEQLGQWFPMPETQHWWCSQGVHISKYFKLVMMDRVYIPDI